MKEMMIGNINFHEVENMRYWSFPSSWDIEKKKKTVNERIFSGTWYGAQKRDGAFYKFIKSDTGEMELIGRSKSTKGDYLNKIDLVPHLHPFFESLPNGTCLLGELYLPSREEAKATTSIMNCLVDKAVKRQEKEKLHYYIFDILADEGKPIIDMPAKDRFNLLNVYWRAYGEGEYEWAQYYTGKELWDKLQELLGEGYEGVVITEENAPYRPGKRPSKETLKVKKELQETIDCVIIGANAPTKEYNGKEIENWTYWFDVMTNQKINKPMYKDYNLGKTIVPVTKPWFNGWAGSFKLGLYKNDNIVHIGNLSGISDDMKANWKENIGKVCEITAMEIMVSEDCTLGLRHPKFVRLRDDKAPEECSYDQLKRV